MLSFLNEFEVILEKKLDSFIFLNLIVVYWLVSIILLLAPCRSAFTQQVGYCQQQCVTRMIKVVHQRDYKPRCSISVALCSILRLQITLKFQPLVDIYFLPINIWLDFIWNKYKTTIKAVLRGNSKPTYFNQKTKTKRRRVALLLTVSARSVGRSVDDLLVIRSQKWADVFGF